MIIKPGANVPPPKAVPGGTRYYTFASSVPGVMQARVQNNKTGQTFDRYSIPGGQLGFTRGKGYYVKQAKAVGNPSEKPAATGSTAPAPTLGTTSSTNPYGLDPAVYSAIAPQMTYLDQVQAQNEAALKGLTLAIMQQLGGISGQIGDQYNQGIAQQQALAQAGSDSLRQANGNAGIQSILGAIGAPTNQQQQITDNLGQVFNGGAAATFGLQGTLPVTRLIADKLAQQNFASELPGIQSVAATNALKNLLASSSNEKLKVLAQVPQIQSDLAKSKLAQQQFALTTRKEAYSEWLGQKKLGLAQQNQSFTQWAKTQGLKFEGQRVVIAQQNANTSATRAAQSYDAQLQRIGIAQQRLSLDQQKFTQQAILNSQKAKRGGFSATKLASFRGAANRIAANAFNGIPDPKNPGKFLAPPLKDDPNGFQKAVLEMFQSKAGAIPLDIALKALNRYWKTPGEGGRPYQELPLRQKLGKAGAAASPAALAKQDAVVSLAKEALGTPYVWGGSKPGGFDCSGLLYYVWGRQGIQIPRTSYDQWSYGKAVSKSTLQPGDAVFFRGSDSIVRGGKTLPGHVAMYVGDGKIIEAYGRGVPVRVTGLAGRTDYMGARRFV